MITRIFYEVNRRHGKMTLADLAAAQVKADVAAFQHWKVVDGVIVYDGQNNNLCTIKDYGDFEMLVDWKIAPKGARFAACIRWE